VLHSAKHGEVSKMAAARRKMLAHQACSGRIGGSQRRRKRGLVASAWRHLKAIGSGEYGKPSAAIEKPKKCAAEKSDNRTENVVMT